jgi:hypothetical protein
MRSRVAAGALVVLVAFLLTPSANAQELTLDQVLSNYYEAIGGLEEWKAVQSIKLVGTRTMGRTGAEVQVSSLSKRPRMSFVEQSRAGVNVVSGFDGEIAWSLNPHISSQPRLLEGEDLERAKGGGDVDGRLVGYEEDGHQVELVGVQDVEGTQTYKLKVTLASGNVEHYYLDSETFLPILSEYSFRGGQGIHR